MNLYKKQMKITIGTKVKPVIGVFKNDIGEVETIIQTNRKHFYVRFATGNLQKYFFRHLTTKIS